MPDDNVAAVRRVYDHWSKGDFDFTELFDPNILFILTPGFPDEGSYLGLDALANYTRQFLQPWDRLTIDVHELTPAGDSVVASVTQQATGVGSGAPSELSYFMVWTLRGGTIIRFENFRDRAEAFAAAGLA